MRFSQALILALFATVAFFAPASAQTTSTETIDGTLCSTNPSTTAGCFYQVTASVFEVSYNLVGGTTAYTGTVSVNAASRLYVDYTDASTFKLVLLDTTTGQATDVITSAGAIGANNYRVDSTADQTPSTTVTLSYLSGCTAPPDELTAFFNPTLDASSTGFSITGSGPRLTARVLVPSFYYDITLDFRNDCGAAAATQVAPVGVEDTGNACLRAYTISIDYQALNCNFPSSETGNTLEVTPTVYVEGKQFLFVTSGNLAAERAVSAPLQMTVSLQTQITVSSSEATVENTDVCTDTDTSLCQNGITNCNNGQCQCEDKELTGKYCQTDSVNPVITCATGTVEVTSLPASGYPAGFVPATATDNLDTDVQITGGEASPTWTALGPNTVATAYVATDDSNNSATCQVTMTVVDRGDPVPTCPASVVTNTWSSWSVSAADAIDPSPSMTLLSPLTAPSTDGAVTVSYTAEDASGNTAGCSFEVTYDTTAPTITCPNLGELTLGSATILTGTGTVSVGAFRAQVTASDALSGLDPAGIAFNADVADNTQVGLTSGQTTLTTASVSDLAGNSASCQVLYSVVDNTAPEIVCDNAATKTFSVGANGCYTVTVADQNGWFSVTGDNNGPAGISSTEIVDRTFCLPANAGAQTLTYSATDGSNNQATCTITVQVQDTTPPSIVNCPASSISLNTDLDQGYATYDVAVLSLSASDNVALTGAVLSGVPANNQYQVGTTTVTYTATDSATLSTDCEFDVIVTDNQPPVANCPADVSINTDSNQNYATYDYGANTSVQDNYQISSQSTIITDSSGTTVTITNNQFPISGSAYTITVNVNDGSQSDSCSFTVTVTDDQDPHIQCPASFTQNTDAGLATAAVTWSVPTVSDNVGVSAITYTEGGVAVNNGDSFSIGPHTITATVTDTANPGNTASCPITFTVVDNEIPGIVCPTSFDHNGVSVNIVNGAASISTDAGQPHATVTIGAATASDNSGVTPSITYSGYVVGSSQQLAITSGAPHSFSATATDGALLQNTCSFTITVIDNENPVISVCPADITETITTNSNTFTVSSLGAITATDNSGSFSVSDDAPAGLVFNFGSTTVTYTVSDAANNQITCEQTVTINDGFAPVVSNCPVGPFTVLLSNGNTNPNHNNPVLSWSDNIDTTGSLTLNQNQYATGIIPTGTTQTVTYTATDLSGNIGTCSYDVSVVDDSGPDFTCPSDPAPLSVTTTATADYTYDFSSFEAQGTFASTDFASSSGTKTGVPIGSNSYSFTISNGFGSKTCTVTVSVTDDGNPVASCPQDITVRASLPTATSAIVSYSGASCTDNSGSCTLSSSQESGSAFNLGANTVTITASDAASPPNTDTCTFTITVLNPFPAASLDAFLSAVNVEAINAGNLEFGARIDVTTLTTYPHRVSWNSAAGPVTGLGQVDGVSPVGEGVAISASCPQSDGATCTEVFQIFVPFPTCNYAQQAFNLPFQTECQTAVGCNYGTEDWTVTFTLSANDYCGTNLGNTDLQATMFLVTQATHDQYSTDVAGLTAPDMPADPTETLAWIEGDTMYAIVKATSTDVVISTCSTDSASITFTRADSSQYSVSLISAGAALGGSNAAIGNNARAHATFAWTVTGIPLDSAEAAIVTATIDVTYNLGNTAGGRRRALLSLKSTIMPKSNIGRALQQATGDQTAVKTVEQEGMFSNVRMILPEGVNEISCFLMFTVNKPTTMMPTAALTALEAYFVRSSGQKTWDFVLQLTNIGAKATDPTVGVTLATSCPMLDKFTAAVGRAGDRQLFDFGLSIVEGSNMRGEVATSNVPLLPAAEAADRTTARPAANGSSSDDDNSTLIIIIVICVVVVVLGAVGAYCYSKSKSNAKPHLGQRRQSKSNQVEPSQDGSEDGSHHHSRDSVTFDDVVSAPSNGKSAELACRVST